LGIFRTISIKKEANITVWKITESEEELFSRVGDDEKVSKALLIKATIQRKQFLVSQILLQELNLKESIFKNINGKPLLNNGEYISISHDTNFVAIMVSKYPCGIDLQSISSKVLKIKSKFVDDSDCFTTSLSEEDLTLAWSVKEALYKINGDPMVYFKEHLRLISQNKDEMLLNALILHESYSQELKLRYRKLEDVFLVYNIA
jgi:phosphopantetheinyl transferase